jgi:hypothetical protein
MVTRGFKAREPNEGTEHSVDSQEHVDDSPASSNYGAMPTRSFTARDFKEGEKDELYFHKHVKVFIYCIDDIYFVYLDDDYGIWWYHTTGEFDPEFGSIRHQVSELEAEQIRDLSTKDQCSFRTLVANGIAHGLDGEIEEAKLTLARARLYLEQRRAELSRRWFLSIGLGGAIVAGLGIALVNIGVTRPNVSFSSSFSPRVVTMLLAGVVGAGMSLVIRIGKMPVDPSAGRWMHYLEGLARLATGFTAAWIVFLVYKSRLALESLFGEGDIHLLALIGFVAGTSERYMSNVIRAVGSALGDREQGDEADLRNGDDGRTKGGRQRGPDGAKAIDGASQSGESTGGEGEGDRAPARAEGQSGAREGIDRDQPTLQAPPK